MLSAKRHAFCLSLNVLNPHGSVTGFMKMIRLRNQYFHNKADLQDEGDFPVDLPLSAVYMRQWTNINAGCY